jgi:hypothetical protein
MSRQQTKEEQLKVKRMEQELDSMRALLHSLQQKLSTTNRSYILAKKLPVPIFSPIFLHR